MTSLTRLQNFISVREFKVNELQARYDELPTIYNKYDSAQNELEISDDDDHSMDREVFEEQYYETKARLLELLHPIESPNLLDSSAEPNVSNSSSTRGNTQIRLPTIELPTFSGDACKWLHFRDTFHALVIDNNALSNIQKFHYLISSPKDEAKMLIVNLPVTSDNFSVAWKLVTQRYNNVKLIAMKHVKQLVHMPQVKGRDSSSLHRLINHVSSHTNALQALNLQATMHDLILNHLLLSVLGAETHKEWELHSSRVQDLPSTKEIMEFLEDRCKAMELLQANQATGNMSPRNTQHTGSNVSQPSRCTLTTQLQCPSCKGPHGLFHCNEFLKLPPQQRYEHAKQVKACINCLQAFNKNHRCTREHVVNVVNVTTHYCMQSATDLPKATILRRARAILLQKSTLIA
jgi:hypothetical protein